MRGTWISHPPQCSRPGSDVGAIATFIRDHVHIHVHVQVVESRARGLACRRATCRIHTIECLASQHIVTFHTSLIGPWCKRMPGRSKGRARLSSRLKESQQRLLSWINGFRGRQHRLGIHGLVARVHWRGHLLLLLLCREDPAERFLWWTVSPSV